MSSMAEVFRVNGVVVGCYMCKHYALPFTTEPCESCFRASHGSKSIEHAAFDPKDDEQFERMRQFVEKYSSVFFGMEQDASHVGVPLKELCKSFVPTRDIRDIKIK